MNKKRRVAIQKHRLKRKKLKLKRLDYVAFILFFMVAAGILYHRFFILHQ